MPSIRKSSKKHNSSNVKYVAIQKGLITIIMKFPRKPKSLRKTRHKHTVGGEPSKEAKMVLSIVRNPGKNLQGEDNINKAKEISENAEKYAREIGTNTILKLYEDRTMDANQKFFALIRMVDEGAKTKNVETRISEELDKLVSMGKITPAKKQSILDTMSNKGIVSTVSKSAVNAINKSASAIGSWLTPPNMGVKWPPNKTTVKLLYYPSVHQMDTLNPDSNTKSSPPPFGEVILLVDDAYANTYEMFRKKFGSVDDMFKILIEGSSTNPNNTIPRAQQILNITDNEPAQKSVPTTSV